MTEQADTHDLMAWHFQNIGERLESGSTFSDEVHHQHFCSFHADIHERLVLLRRTMSKGFENTKVKGETIKD